MTDERAKAARVAGFFVLMLGSGLILDHGSMRLALVLIGCGATSLVAGIAALGTAPRRDSSEAASESPAITQPEDQ